MHFNESYVVVSKIRFLVLVYELLAVVLVDFNLVRFRLNINRALFTE